jgi:REP element-mobilizing transposase RayT
MMSTVPDDPKPFPQRKHLTRIPVWLPLEQSVVYLVTACCAQRRKVFVQSDTVRVGAECLGRIAKRQGWDVVKVCFMPDHVHVLLSPLKERDQSLSDFIRAWKSCVMLRLRRNGVIDEVWQREFHDRLLRSDEKLEEKWEYVRQNPVRAGLCREPEEYPFSGTTEEILRRLAGTARGV